MIAGFIILICGIGLCLAVVFRETKPVKHEHNKIAAVLSVVALICPICVMVTPIILLLFVKPTGLTAYTIYRTAAASCLGLYIFGLICGFIKTHLTNNEDIQIRGRVASIFAALFAIAFFIVMYGWWDVYGWFVS